MKMGRIIKYATNITMYTGAFTLGIVKGFNLGTGHQSAELINLGLIGVPVLNGLASMGLKTTGLAKADSITDVLMGPLEMIVWGAVGSIGSGVCEGIGIGCGALAGCIAKNYSHI
jgi:hypothetical protein